MIVTREQADALLDAAPGPAHLAVPKAGHPFHHMDGRYNGPPTEWVALTEPCRTCGGRGSEMSGGPGYWMSGRVVRVAGGNTMTNIVCHDCIGSGRRRFPITVKCHHHLHDTSRLDGGWGVCTPGACRNGKITLGSAEVIKVLPVIEFVFGNEALTAGVPQAVIAEDGGCAVWDGAGDIIRIDPIGTPKPGGYIIHIDNIAKTDS